MAASTIRNQEAIRNWFKLFNTGDFPQMKTTLREMSTQDYKLHDPSAKKPEVGLDEVLEDLEKFMQGVSNPRVEIQDIFGVGDKTAARITYEWIETATNEHKKGIGIVISRFEKGKFAEDWQVMVAENG